MMLILECCLIYCYIFCFRFLQFLVQTTNLNQYKVHCIGHSLGAHICGYMGKEVGKIFRISGR